MSANLEQQRSGLISDVTILRSLAHTLKDRELEREDLRTRRFGYNPGIQYLEMAPRISGLQSPTIGPGKLIVFETSPVAKQRFSVDPNDKTPPMEAGEILAGEGLNAIAFQYAEMGFGELLPLRGLDNSAALDLFYDVHPPISEGVSAGLIPECIYHQDQDTCITCRRDLLNAIEANRSQQTLMSALKQLVNTGRGYMAAQWGQWMSEMARTKGNQPRAGISELTEGHLWYMRQLHQRTPTDQELAKIQLQSQAQAEIMREQAALQTAAIVQAIESRDKGDSAEVIALRAEMAELRRLVAATARPVEPEAGKA